MVLLVSKLRCRGISLSVSALPPSVAEQSASFEFFMAERYELPPHGAHLYEPPFLAIAAPPPEAAVL